MIETLIERIAAQMGESYETMAARYNAMHMQESIRFTPAMIRLCASRDRRQRKRGLRLYLKANGSEAPRSPLAIKASWYRTELDRAYFQRNFVDAIYAVWIKEAVASGQVELPSTGAQERK